MRHVNLVCIADFTEFMLFMLFKICDADDDGYISMQDMTGRLQTAKVGYRMRNAHCIFGADRWGCV